MYNIKDFQYMISFFCPGKCKNCGIWKYDAETIREGEISLDSFESVLKSKALENTGYFILTGGEVQLSPKYVGAVKLISKYKPDSFIHTNISGWYPEIHEKIVVESLEFTKPENFRIDISLDGKPENYEKVRFVKNGWEKAVKTAELLKKITDNIRFVFTIYKENMNDILWIDDFGKEMGISVYYEFARQNIFLNNSGLTDESTAFNNEELVFIEENLNKIGFLDRIDRKLKWERAKGVYKGKVPFFDCLSGTESLSMDPYGNIFPCIELSDTLKMGRLNDFDNNLDTLLNSKQALDIVDKIKMKKCQPCTMLCVQKAVSNSKN